MLVLPADHVIAMCQLPSCGAVGCTWLQPTANWRLSAFAPLRLKPADGYIRLGEQLSGCDGVYTVGRFVEKPDLDTAVGYLASGDYFWNSGMFLFKPEVYLAELARLQPKIIEQTRQAFEGSYRDLDFCRLEQKAFAECPSDSIDYAVMEHTGLAVVVPVDIGWNDVGSWTALWEVQGGMATGIPGAAMSIPRVCRIR